ncbi:peptidoglycan DD-metalloendopeptidase family protein [Flavobacterium sp. GT3R68]|uniref:peptidoglycan DD-metalloendopeptidase family protein n=1 Tax=Flavobacterium sp. GT3R68 TaxID=2594437 RepID=UPI000F865285|nr:peptidoglycan DD-metalloendopeptidase family protein [Flavobacterium sp. GT3R68]RTY87511.1 peptidase M23 [Flavobacterium sp. GSN2]TRW90422.1 peptidoglycan DD-metalloendopeptidase family protein [Flavobacterium sp. GT3R68]
MSTFLELLQKINNVKVIDASIDYKYYIPLDLSASNSDLASLNLTDAIAFEAYIENNLTKNDAEVAFGGYREVRNLYKRSTVFKNDISEERNIHIGLDLWIKAGTSVLAALDGKVHSFQNNKSIGDYGPTIILEHQIENMTFYTLYGHLSEQSLVGMEVGRTVHKGQQIAALGDASVNGDYAPHLHFQLIKNIKYYSGDYPGVCSQKDLEYYSENCPDPNLLLKII